MNTAIMSEEDLAILQAVLTKYMGEKVSEWSINEELYQDCLMKSDDLSLDKPEAANVILKELWNRLVDTHKLKVVK